jgi:glycosyltransferase involved in cell wall biosynthesis
MATYGDFSGVYFTIQSLRLYHDLTDVEILVVDNKGDKRLKNWISYWGKNLVTYQCCNEVVGTTVPRDMVFRYATGDYVICVDSHVLLYPGALDRLWNGDALVHGPMMYDDGKSCTTEMKDEWRSNMWGIWADARNYLELPEEPFSIWGHGLGLFGCRRDSWLGFNKDFRGFGGEEGYIHVKYRQAGREITSLDLKNSD